MTRADQTADPRDCGADVAAYALGALAPTEADAFRVHLDTCVVCGDELVAFQHVIDVLPITAPQQPMPKRLRRRALDAVDRDRSREPGSERRREPRRWPARLSPPRPAPGLSAALAIIAVTIAGIDLSSSAATSRRVFAARVTGPGSAEVTVNGGRSELVVHHFPAPPPGQIYEVWLLRPGRVPAATSALFGVTAQGNGDVEVPGNLHGVSSVIVTPEPAGGSRVPTHPAVIRARLS